ncbi:hypothetical protein [Marinobacter flavimaris]|jgi:hypothetical protein|uniref:hypothetical protein n=1 Tax=Marinobacter flavimaris TaxID=262076 RepID=UPI0038650FE2
MSFLNALRLSSAGAALIWALTPMALVYFIVDFINTYFLGTIKSILWLFMLLFGAFVAGVISNKILDRWMKQTALVTLLIGWFFSAFLIYSAVDLTLYAIDHDQLSSNYIIFKLSVFVLFSLLSIFMSGQVQMFQPSGDGMLSLFVACIPALFFFTLSLYRIIETCFTGICAPFQLDMVNIHYASTAIMALSLALFLFLANGYWEDKTLYLGELTSLALLIAFVTISPEFAKADRILVALCGTLFFFIFMFLSLSPLCEQKGLGMRDIRTRYVPLVKKIRRSLTNNSRKLKIALSLTIIAGVLSTAALTLPPYFLVDRTISSAEIRDKINKQLPKSKSGITIQSIEAFNLLPNGRAEMDFLVEAERYGDRFPIAISASVAVKSDLEARIIYISGLKFERFESGYRGRSTIGHVFEAVTMSLEDQTKRIIGQNISRTVYDFQDNLYERFLSRFIRQIDVGDGIITIRFQKR